MSFSPLALHPRRDLGRHDPQSQRMLQLQDAPGLARDDGVMPPPQPKQVGQPRDAHSLLPAVGVPAHVLLAPPQARWQSPVPQRDCPAFLVHTHPLTRRQRGSMGPQDWGRLRAPVPPFVPQAPRDVAPMTQTPARARRPKRCAAFPALRSGTSRALGIWVRPLGHEVLARVLLPGLPGTGDRPSQSPSGVPHRPWLGRGPCAYAPWHPRPHPRPHAPPWPPAGGQPRCPSHETRPVHCNHPCGAWAACAASPLGGARAPIPPSPGRSAGHNTREAAG